jgi:hypothetical protein
LGRCIEERLDTGLFIEVQTRWLRELCEHVQKQTLPARFAPYAPDQGFDPNIVAFATAIVELQEKRHRADYDPLIRVSSSEAILVVKAARAALARLQQAEPSSRDAFLTLLLFRPRPGSDRGSG